MAQQLYDMRPAHRRLLVTVALCALLAPLLHIEAALAQSEPAPPETVSERLDGLPRDKAAEEAQRRSRDADKGKVSGQMGALGAEEAEEADGEGDEAANEPEGADGGDPAGDETADDPDATEAEDAETADDVITSEVVEAPIPFTMLGARVPEGAVVWVRTADADEDWTEWVELEVAGEEDDGPDPDSVEARDAGDGWRRASEPLWVNEADRLQVRVEGGAPEDVRVTLIDSMGLGRSIGQRLWDHVRGAFRATANSASASTMPDVVTRREWGADESMRNGDPSYARGGVKAAVVHHTAGSNNYDRRQAPGLVRGIYRYHTQDNGWNDIGYNMLVDRYGTVYEGRYGGLDRAVIGAHAAGWNTGTFGISVLGHFDHASIPSAALNAVSKAIGWKASVHGFDPAGKATLNGRTIDAIVGHRDVGSTSCPGGNFYSKLGQVRSGARDNWDPRGTSGLVPVTGDWNGDGVNRPGWFVDGRFYIRQSDGSMRHFGYGRGTDLPIVGDWNGNGVDTVGVVRDGRWYLRNSNTQGKADLDFKYGRVLKGDYPLAGDWNGNGQDTVGIVRGGEWHLRNENSGGPGQIVFTYGRVLSGDYPVTGDWNGNGRDTPGIVRDREWHLRNANRGGKADIQFNYGLATDIPVTGDWNYGGRDAPGVARGFEWLLRNTPTSGKADQQFHFSP